MKFSNDTIYKIIVKSIPQKPEIPTFTKSKEIKDIPC